MSRHCRELWERFEELEKQYIGKNGIDGDPPKGFIPRSALVGELTTRKVKAILAAGDPRSSLQVTDIAEHFLGVFALLVYINKVEFLDLCIEKNLRDHQFPLDPLRSPFPDLPAYRELLKAIHESQYKLFPVTFDQPGLYSQAIGPHHILPICQEEVLKKGHSVTVSKIKTSPECAAFGHTTFVRKCYKESSRDYFDRELKAFNSSQGHLSDHVVKCYTSFRQKKPDNTFTYNLILEYIDGGTLEGFFCRMSPPQDIYEVKHFWQAFIGVFEGLIHLHIDARDPSSQMYQLIHQDIKPENILVRRGSSGHPYDFDLVIADFGHTHTKPKCKDETDTMGIDLHGGQTYGAPECSHHARCMQKGKNRINVEADIFSIGAVMSDAAAFVIGGLSQRTRYKEKRVTETQQLPAFIDSGSEGCFHNGVNALKAVGYMHREICDKTCGTFDTVTPRVVEILHSHMLLRAGDGRWTAKELWDTFTEITQGVNPPSTTSPSSQVLKQPLRQSSYERLSQQLVPQQGIPRQQPPRQPPPRQPAPRQPWQSQSVQLPPVMALAQEVRRVSTGNVEPILGRGPLVESPPNTTTPYPPPSQLSQQGGNPSRLSVPGIISPYNLDTNGRQINTSQIPKLSLFDLKLHRSIAKGRVQRPFDEEVHRTIQQLQSNLKDRDHIFFIDVSGGMREYRDNIESAFTELGYVAKGIDTNGIELFFSSDPQTPHKGTTTALLKKFHRQKWDQCTFEDKFAAFINKRVLPTIGSWKSKLGLYTTKKLSVYVFTDGDWGNNDGLQGAGGVENPIKKLIERMQDKGVSRTQIMIQFIQFGTNPVGTANLNYLDTLGVRYNCDFVDTKPVDGNVYEIFIGAIQDSIDKLWETPTQSNPSTPTCPGTGPSAT